MNIRRSCCKSSSLSCDKAYIGGETAFLGVLAGLAFPFSTSCGLVSLSDFLRPLCKYLRLPKIASCFKVDWAGCYFLRCLAERVFFTDLTPALLVLLPSYSIFACRSSCNEFFTGEGGAIVTSESRPLPRPRPRPRGFRSSCFSCFSCLSNCSFLSAVFFLISFVARARAR